MWGGLKTIPQGLKPDVLWGLLSARLKAVPFQSCGSFSRVVACLFYVGRYTSIPQGLKPGFLCGLMSARLKAVPFQSWGVSVS
jgi:hypothetical protein